MNLHQRNILTLFVIIFLVNAHKAESKNTFLKHANHACLESDHLRHEEVNDEDLLVAPVTQEEILEMQTVASRVLNDLKKAKGILATEAPNLIVKKFVGSQKIAVMKMDEGEIHLDVRTYKTCRKMGADSLNGLAFILGHELGHFIHGHSEINHNIIDEINDEISSTQMRMVVTSNTTEESEPGLREGLSNALRAYRDTYDEAEADFEGGFLGYLAGYEPMNAGKDFLKRVYSNRLMNLSDTTAGYPSLNERINIVENTGEELNTLTPLFEMSNYLMAIEQYEDAIPYLEKVLEKFQSREIYNNIGVIYLLETLRLFEKPITEYKFPLTLDASFRGPIRIDPQEYSGGTTLTDREGITITQNCELSLAQKQITKATEFFHKATLLDQNYAIGLLNLSVAQSIKAILYKGAKNSFRGNDCEEKKKEELTKAMASALSAKEIVKLKLSKDTLQYYTKEASDTVILQTFSGAFFTEPRSPNSIFPIRIEYFNKENLIIDGYEANQIVDTKWNTDGVTPIAAITLSNIHTQIDLIKILKGELKNKRIASLAPFDSHSESIKPFARAMHLNKQNTIALHNQKIALELDISELLSTSTHDDQKCTMAETVNGKHISSLVSRNTLWTSTEKINKSKLMLDYKNEEETISILEQSMSFLIDADYRLYLNSSDFYKDLRTEKSIMYSHSDLTNLSTGCGISVGSSLNDLLEKYGPPKRTITLSSGSYSVYELLKTHTDINSSAPKKYNEDGIIFKLDHQNQVNSWVLYNRSIGKFKSI